MDIVKKRRQSEITGFSRFFPRGAIKKNHVAGGLEFGEDQKWEDASIELIEYNKSKIEERSINNVEEIPKFKNSKDVSWINVNGVHDSEMMNKIGEHFNLHSLILEDLTNVHQRPKIDEYNDVAFIVLKMLSFDEATKNLNIEQVSLVLGKNFVLSFQEKKGDVFDEVRERIRSGRKKIRESGADYLAYSLIDSIVDSYYTILERVGEHMEELESELINDPSHNTQKEIYRMKRELILLRKSIWPLREVISTLVRGETKFISDSTLVFLRDVHDHAIQAVDTIETFRDMLSGMLDSYLSAISNKMNEVMKVLTIIATIFIPLTFIVGVYGMNFKYMPELSIWWFYPLVWGVMLVVAISMVIYFKKKKWM